MLSCVFCCLLSQPPGSHKASSGAPAVHAVLQPEQTKKRLKNVMRFVAVAMVPLTYKMPAGVFCYWLASNLFALCQVRGWAQRRRGLLGKRIAPDCILIRARGMAGRCGLLRGRGGSSARPTASMVSRLCSSIYVTLRFDSQPTKRHQALAPLTNQPAWALQALVLKIPAVKKVLGLPDLKTAHLSEEAKLVGKKVLTLGRKPGKATKAAASAARIEQALDKAAAKAR
jgi:hypothetical protein